MQYIVQKLAKDRLPILGSNFQKLVFESPWVRWDRCTGLQNWLKSSVSGLPEFLGFSKEIRGVSNKITSDWVEFDATSVSLWKRGKPWE